MAVSVSFKSIEASPLLGENPLPFFRAVPHDVPVEVRPDFPQKYMQLLGYETGYRVLPYKKQDRYFRKREKTDIRVIILENDKLRAEFFPQYGARLTSLVCKETGRELLYNNEIFQPANLGIRNAWFSGGIEWNIGQYGHTFTTCSPLFCAKITDPRTQEEFLRIYEYERCKGVYWQIDFHLPQESSLLYAYTRIINPLDKEVPMYWWTNAALPETAETRVFSNTPEVVYIDPFVEKGKKKFGFGMLPTLDIAKDVDSSYPAQSKYSNEYFFMCDTERMPWEVAVEKDGSGFLELSTDMLKYKKMFCWGNLAGGVHWTEFLGRDSVTKETKYFEAQAGLAPTQMHGLIMPAQTEWAWTQAFGAFQADAQKVLGTPWIQAQQCVQEEVERRITADELYVRHQEYAQAANSATAELLHNGSGWGALQNELHDMERKQGGSLFELPKSFYFPQISLDVQQSPWLNLLRQGFLLSSEPDALPHAYMIGDNWEELLFKSLEDSSDIYRDKCVWTSLLHLGVMAMERNSPHEAVAYWKKSFSATENAWALRNIAVAEKNWGNIEAALQYYDHALDSVGGKIDISITQEFLTLLVSSKRFEKGLEVYHSLSEEWKNDDTCLIQYGYCLAAQPTVPEHVREIERILKHDFANIREGDTPLSDLWFAIKKANKSIDELPAHLDFRMV